MSMLISVSAGVLFLVGIVAYKLWSANRTIDKLFEAQNQLQDEIRQQKAEIQQKTVEVQNAKIANTNRQTVQRANDDGVDRLLHDKGYYRDE